MDIKKELEKLLAISGDLDKDELADRMKGLIDKSNLPPAEQRDRQEDLKKLAKAFFFNLEIDNCEFGGIGVDSKRPFGNSYVKGDILEIIGWENEGRDSDGACYADYQKEYAYNLYHKHLIPYLQENFGK